MVPARIRGRLLARSEAGLCRPLGARSAGTGERAPLLVGWLVPQGPGGQGALGIRSRETSSTIGSESVDLQGFGEPSREPPGGQRPGTTVCAII